MGYSLVGAIVGFVMGWALHWYWLYSRHPQATDQESPAPSAGAAWEETPLVEPSVAVELSTAEEEETPVAELADLARPVTGTDPPESAPPDVQGDAEPVATAYCAHCRTQRPVSAGEFVETKRGRRAIRGICAECGGKMFSFVKSPG